MIVTATEKIMYDVMRALYESGIPISFKGSMVLKAYLLEAGYMEETRHTVDIDANWYSSTPPSAEQMIESFQSAMTAKKLKINVGIYRMYGEGRSAGFELKDSTSGEVLCTMDVDVNDLFLPTKLYEINGLCFRGVVPVQMISDKLSVISSGKVLRRIKDVVDMYYISKVIILDYCAVTEALNNSSKRLGDFSTFLHCKEELSHAYEKFRFSGDVNKPSFEDVYQEVKGFIKDFFTE